MSKKKIIENGKIHFYQTSTEEVIDLGDVLSLEEIGYYLVIKNAYIKYCGKIEVEDLPRFCKIFNKKEQKKIQEFAKNYFKTEKIILNPDWNIIINEIQGKSEKATYSVGQRWKKDTNEDTNEDTNGDTNINVSNNVNVNDNKNNKENIIPKRNCAKEMIEIWNEVCLNLPKSTEHVTDRNKKLNALIGNSRVKDADGKPLFEEIDDWKAFCKMINDSDFLSRQWGKANIDWVLKPANMIKIYEGNYGNKESN